MATIVYLDAEDEITSAAARIRAAADTRVAVVVPFGSRVATSRINFRLLAREAMVNGKRLDIVAPDASARALAASAGIPVFASVGEYESAIDTGLDQAAESGSGAKGAAAAAGAAGLAAAGAAGAVGSAGAGAASGRATPGAEPRPSDPRTGAPTDPDEVAAREAELDAVVRRSREIPVVKPRRRIRGGLVASLLLLIVALGVAGVAAYLFLPAADIAVTPQIVPVGPIDLVVRADPAATVVDPENLVIPAQTVTVPVEVSGEFPATGVRNVTTPATGGVRWKNCDPSSPYTIPRRTIVRTADGRGFSIDEEVFLPVAVIEGGGTSPTLRCQTSEVAVTAVEEGPEGNVAEGTIRVVPARYNRNLVTVTNPNPTKGGTRESFTRVAKKDVDAALATLEGQLAGQFQVELENPEHVPPGTTVFPETAVLGEATPTPDPTTLIGQEVESFELSMTAEGTVTAVDSTPVEAIAEDALAQAVAPGSELVAGSTTVDVGEGTVAGGVVTFEVTGSAKQVQPVDAATLLPQVLGLTEAEAQALLEPYGEVDIALWPGWVTTVPTFERRVTLVVEAPVDTTPTPAPTAAPTEPPDSTAPPDPTPTGTQTEDGGPSGEPVPSG